MSQGCAAAAMSRCAFRGRGQGIDNVARGCVSEMCNVHGDIRRLFVDLEGITSYVKNLSN
jgi:hypothetical protein